MRVGLPHIFRDDHLAVAARARLGDAIRQSIPLLSRVGASCAAKSETRARCPRYSRGLETEFAEYKNRHARPGESYSDVILRLAAVGHGPLNVS